MLDNDEWRGCPGRQPDPGTSFVSSDDVPEFTLSDLDLQPVAVVWLIHRFGLPPLRARVIAQAAGLGGE
jgi:hypothetical protein